MRGQSHLMPVFQHSSLAFVFYFSKRWCNETAYGWPVLANWPRPKTFRNGESSPDICTWCKSTRMLHCYWCGKLLKLVFQHSNGDSPHIFIFYSSPLQCHCWEPGDVDRIKETSNSLPHILFLFCLQLCLWFAQMQLACRDVLYIVNVIN